MCYTFAMRTILKELVADTPGVVQMRYHRRKSLVIRAENGRISTLSSSLLSGTGVRVHRAGVWGFSSTSDMSRKKIAEALREAIAAAAAARGGSGADVRFACDPATGVFTVAAERPFSRIPLEEKLALVRTIEEKMRRVGGTIVSTSVSYAEMEDEKIIVTSDGADAEYRDAKMDFRANAVAADGNEMEFGTVMLGATGGWGDLFRRVRPEDVPERAVRKAMDKLGAPVPAGGMSTVILHPSLVGLLAHEAIGHTVEADFVLAGSIVKDKIGEKVAGEKISLVDDPLCDRDPSGAGVLLVDDEGTRPKKAVIIERGVLRGFLHDAETAAHFHVENTGNARAFTYRDEPVIRMRNTYLLPGEDTVEAMISSTENGLYLKDFGMGGQADANAEFMFDVGEARKIEHGKITAMLKGVTISGQAFEVLSSVDMVGNDFLLDSGAGYCGKHQPAKVDAGGPHIRCRMMIGGKL